MEFKWDIHVPQISLRPVRSGKNPTDFTDEHRFLCGLGGLEFERVTQISQMTQIF